MANGKDAYWSRVIGTLRNENGLPVLDGIRAISCIWVSSSHALLLWQVSAPELFQRVYNRWWPISLPFSGDMGVDFFLLLSGYLIGLGVIGEIAQSGSFGWLRFYVRRVFRIAPVLWLAVFLAAATQGLEACSGVWWRKLLFVENNSVNLQEEGGRCGPQTWSVGLEMQLYVITPPMITLSFCTGKACGVPPTRVVMLICACAWAACCGVRLAPLPAVLAQTGSVWYTGTQYRCAPYFSGVATAALLFEQGPVVGPPTGGASHEGTASAVLHGTLTVLASAVLVFFMYFGAGGPLLGFESPMSKYPFGKEAAQLHFIFGRPLVGAAAAYLLWKILRGFAPRLHRALAAPMWRPFARLSYSAYMMQVVSFALAGWLLSPLASPSGAAAKAIVALSETSTILLLYAWSVLYIFFAFALAFLSYVSVEYPGMGLGRRVALALARPPAARCDELVKPLVGAGGTV